MGHSARIVLLWQPSFRRLRGPYRSLSRRGISSDRLVRRIRNYVDTRNVPYMEIWSSRDLRAGINKIRWLVSGSAAIQRYNFPRIRRTPLPFSEWPKVTAQTSHLLIKNVVRLSWGVVGKSKIYITLPRPRDVAIISSGRSRGTYNPTRYWLML